MFTNCLLLIEAVVSHWKMGRRYGVVGEGGEVGEMQLHYRYFVGSFCVGEGGGDGDKGDVRIYCYLFFTHTQLYCLFYEKPDINHELDPCHDKNPSSNMDDYLWQDKRRSTLNVQPSPDGDVNNESRFLKSTNGICRPR